MHEEWKVPFTTSAAIQVALNTGLPRPSLLLGGFASQHWQHQRLKMKKKKKNKPAEIARTFGDLYHNTPSWTTSPTETSLKQNAICTRVYNSGLKPRTLEGLRYTKFSESHLQRILPFYELFINASLKIEWKVVASKFTSSASFNTDYNNRWKQER